MNTPLQVLSASAISMKDAFFFELGKLTLLQSILYQKLMPISFFIKRFQKRYKRYLIFMIMREPSLSSRGLTGDQRRRKDIIAMGLAESVYKLEELNFLEHMKSNKLS